MDEDIETAAAFRFVTDDGTDISDRLTVSGEFPDVQVAAADSEIAEGVARFELKSPRSDLWVQVHIGDTDRRHLARGGELRFDGRLRYTT